MRELPVPCCHGRVRGLISVIDLVAQRARGEVCIVDVQYSLMGPPSTDLYAVAHIPGAPHLSLDAALAGAPGSGGRHPLPDAAVLQEALRQCGIHDSTDVVVYDQLTSLAAARAWWVLRWAGHPQVRVLDGGLAAWRAAGGDVTTEAAHPAYGSISVRPGSVAVLDAASAAAMTEQGVLLDVRTPERFRGEVEPIDAVAGRIPGSVNLPMGEFLRDDGTFRPPGEIRAAAASVGVRRDTPLGTSCGSGVTAAQAVLALHEAGLTAIPYIGSWSEWITDPARPVATGP